jgi:hypothetical protein
MVIDAIRMARRNHRIAPGAVFHSDRGAQYTSTDFDAYLKSVNMVGSMGRTGVCWDDSAAESFFATLKKELVYRTAFPTRRHAHNAIGEYIEIFYNRQRIHSTIGYISPQQARLNRSINNRTAQNHSPENERPTSSARAPSSVTTLNIGVPSSPALLRRVELLVRSTRKVRRAREQSGDPQLQAIPRRRVDLRRPA